MHKFYLRLHQFLAFLMVAAVIICTLVTGAILYYSLNQRILNGFDRKLFATGTVLASFLDGGAHNALLEPYRFEGLNRADETGKLSGYDLRTEQIVFLKEETGAGLPWIALRGVELQAVTFVPELGWVGLKGGEGPGALLKIGEDGRTEVIGEVGEGMKGMFYRKEGGLWVFGKGIYKYQWDQASGGKVEVVPGWKQNLNLRAFTPLPEGAGYVGILEKTKEEEDGESGQELVFWDTQGNETGRKTIQGVESADLIKGLILGWGENVLAVVQEVGLGTVNLETGEVVTEGMALGFRSEEEESYARPVRRMQNIMQRLDLTYLYTQVLLNDLDIQYVLDGTIGEDHSSLGAEDQLPEDGREDIHRVQTEGAVYLSGIQKWENWGLLKTAFAPIRNKQGEVVAMTGADVNISIITQHKRRAMLQLVVAAFVVIAAGMGVSFLTGYRLVRPLNKLKEGALRAAAGVSHLMVEIESPRELKSLSETFNQISSTLKSSLEEMVVARKELELRRKRNELSKALGGGIEMLEVSIGPMFRAKYFGSSLRGVDASGYAVAGDRVLIWLAEARGNGLVMAQRRADFLVLGRKLLAENKVTEEELLVRVLKMGESFFKGVILYDFKSREFRWLALNEGMEVCWRQEEEESWENLTGHGHRKLEESMECLLFGRAPRQEVEGCTDWLDQIFEEKKKPERLNSAQWLMVQLGRDKKGGEG